MNFKQKNHLSKILGLDSNSIDFVVQSFSEGATIPFLARYRKEKTGELDEVQLQAIKSAYEDLIALDKRKEYILKVIAEQEKLTPEIRQKIDATFDINVLEDIYLPFKKKRKTRAAKAIEAGLKPLADIIQAQKENKIRLIAKSYTSDTFSTIDDALSGAKDIIAERINEDPWVRKMVREAFKKHAVVSTKSVKSKEKEGQKYKDYFEYNELLNKCPSHRFLAILRAESEGYIRVKLTPDAERTSFDIIRKFVNKYQPCHQEYREAIEDAYKRLIEPSIENQTRAEKKLEADKKAIEVFADNAEQLLMSAPLGEKRIMGIDPGFRSGCKVVCLDKNGSLLANDTIYPHPPQSNHHTAAKKISEFCQKYRIEAIAIGNGTAGRETHRFCKEIPFVGSSPTIFLVNEDGASIYSASEIAREEFPDHDITVRGSVSIARRLMDPLAELVKIDPKSIGVGQYQHDVNQSLLQNKLTATVESAVNKVGINLNTSSKHLLTYIAGLGPTLAENIVKHRSQNGPFKKISEIKKVTRLGDKAFEQCAGFLRIKDASNPLDDTGVHPERYKLVRKMARKVDCDITQLIDSKEKRQSIPLSQFVSQEVGLPTLHDIISELDKPGLDPRGMAKELSFNDKIREITDLKEGMILPGVVNNITDFGAFIDLGIKESGLVHISQIANKFIKHPNEILKLNQEVTVKIMQLDMQRKRIQLSMKEV